MKFIIGKKNEMTQIFTDDGVAHPVTAIEVAPIVVTQIKNKEKDGYNAVQFGYGSSKEKNISRPVKGHIKTLGNFSGLKEFRTTEANTELKVGDKVEVSVFTSGDVVAVSGISKGKGFQGVVKRHGFHGGPRTHGQKHSEREPGSIGGGLRTRVPKGMRMAGRMGGEKVTVKNLKVILIDSENNVIFIEGAVPGRRGSILEIRG